MAKIGNAGIGKLADTLDRRMGEHQEGQFVPDFGVIKNDMSLVTDTFPVPIADYDYSVCRHLAAKLKPGDRVLVIWANAEAVVVDAIIKASSI